MNSSLMFKAYTSSYVCPRRGPAFGNLPVGENKNVNQDAIKLCQSFMAKELPPVDFVTRVDSLYGRISHDLTEDLEVLYNITEMYSPIQGGEEPYLDDDQLRQKVQAHLDKYVD